MGLTLAAVGVASGIVQAGLIKPAIRVMGERITLIVGLLCGVTGFVIYGFSSAGWMFWAGIPVLALWGMGSAAAMALMSRLVSGSEQGQLQGACASLVALAGLVGPWLFAQTFAWSIAPEATWHFPGAPFLLAAAMLAGATALAWRVTRPRPAC
jgi:DHA1 family tetracycline resistance protein-like MFS transporter